MAITTNRLEHIDSALGCPDQGISTRPGRIDRTLLVGPLDEDSRVKLASRILFDRVDLQLRAVDEGDGDTAAQFQERCSRYALSTIWTEKKSTEAMKEDAPKRSPVDSQTSEDSQESQVPDDGGAVEADQTTLKVDVKRGSPVETSTSNAASIRIDKVTMPINSEAN